MVVPDFPEDLRFLCVAWLPLRGLLNCRRLSRQWCALASRDSIWRALCIKHVPATALIQVASYFLLFAKLHKHPSNTSSPVDLSEVYLLLTLTIGRVTKEGGWDEDEEEWLEEEYGYEDIPLKLQLSGARPRGAECSGRELEWLLPPSYSRVARHQINSKAFLWDARNEAVSSLLMNRVITDTPGSRVSVIDGPDERGVHQLVYRSEGPTFRAKLRFGAALADAHLLLEHPKTYLELTFERARCCIRLGRPARLDHIFCALPIIDGQSVAQPGLLKALTLLEWRSAAEAPAAAAAPAATMAATPAAAAAARPRRSSRVASA